MEQINLGASEPLQTTQYRVARLDLDWQHAHIDIYLIGDNGVHRRAEYSGVTATTLMAALNKLDLSVKSLHRRIIERLVADGQLGGTITGVPD